MLRSPLLSLRFAARASRFRALESRPVGSTQVAVDGTDPIRVLLTGAGLAAGYGVSSHQESIAGALAARMAELTERGVVVDVRSSALLRARDAVSRIGPSGAASYDVALFAPCYLEATFAPGSGMVRHGAAIQQHLLDTGGDRVHVVMLGLPRPKRFSSLNLAVADAATRTNRAMRSNAGASPRAHFVDSPDFESIDRVRPFDAAYYALLGRTVADEVGAELTASSDRDHRAVGVDARSRPVHA